MLSLHDPDTDFFLKLLPVFILVVSQIPTRVFYTVILWDSDICCFSYKVYVVSQFTECWIICGVVRAGRS